MDGHFSFQGSTGANDGSCLYFQLEPDKEKPADSLYYITLVNKIPAKSSGSAKSSLM